MSKKDGDHIGIKIGHDAVGVTTKRIARDICQIVETCGAVRADQATIQMALAAYRHATAIGNTNISNSTFSGI